MKDDKKRDKEVQHLFETIQKNGTNISVETKKIDTSDYLLVKAENSNLKKEIIELEKYIAVLEEKLKSSDAEIITLKEKNKQNSRNAGRKKMYKTEKFQKFTTLYEQKLSLKDICKRMNMSLRSAYYYRKEYEIYKSFEDDIKKQRY